MFPRSIDSLAAIFEFTERFFIEERIDPSMRFSIDLTVEELFTNLVKHNRGTENEILLSLDRVGEGLVVSLTDYDVEPFDPSGTPEVDVDGPLDERTAGGLGLHLVHKMVDSIDYEYAGRRSKITFRKALSSSGDADVRD